MILKRVFKIILKEYTVRYVLTGVMITAMPHMPQRSMDSKVTEVRVDAGTYI
jgi:hypothetical protein